MSRQQGLTRRAPHPCSAQLPPRGVTASSSGSCRTHGTRRALTPGRTRGGYGPATQRGRGHSTQATPPPAKHRLSLHRQPPQTRSPPWTRTPAPRRPRPRPQPLRGHTRRHSRSSTPCPRSGRAAGSRLCPTSPTCFQRETRRWAVRRPTRLPGRSQEAAAVCPSPPLARGHHAPRDHGCKEGNGQDAQQSTRKQVPQRTPAQGKAPGGGLDPVHRRPPTASAAGVARPASVGSTPHPLKLSLPGPAPEASERPEGTLQKGPCPPRPGGRGTLGEGTWPPTVLSSQGDGSGRPQGAEQGSGLGRQSMRPTCRGECRGEPSRTGWGLRGHLHAPGPAPPCHSVPAPSATLPSPSPGQVN